MKTQMLAFALFLGALIAAGCGTAQPVDLPEDTETDAGFDAGITEKDAGKADAGGGTKDAGKDAGDTDAGQDDTGNDDGGGTSDAGDTGTTGDGGNDDTGSTGDTGTGDTGGTDGGTGSDTGTTDGGTGSDAATDGSVITDGGGTDAGTSDGGTVTDGGAADAGTDAGQPLFTLGPVTGPLVRFSFDSVSGTLFDSPYPNDYYLTAQGTILVPNFPTKTDFVAQYFVDTYVTAAEKIKGFSTNTPVYFGMAGAEQIDTASLPATPTASQSFTSSSVLFLDIDPDSPDKGKLVPAIWHYTAGTTVYEPYGKLLAVSPFDGFPLRPSNTYAVILTDGATAGGTKLGRSQAMADAYSGKPGGDAKVLAAYKPLAEWLAANKATLDPEKVRAATVFTTQDPYSETAKMRDYVRAQYPGGAISGSMTSCAFATAHTGYACFSGKYTSPLFMSGTKPYDLSGGAFTFDTNGNPKVISSETMDFSLCVPTDANPPASGWPVALISHGTGGDFDSYVGDGTNDVSTRLLGAKVATLGLNQPLHGTRGNSYTQQQLEQYSFNVANPDSARTIVRQAALDNVALLAFLKAGKLVVAKTGNGACTTWPTGGQYPGPDTVKLDTGKVLFHGHSQGGLAGAVLAGIEKDIKAYVLSGAGGRMQITIMERQSPNILDMLNAYPNPLGGGTVQILAKTEAYQLHPLFMLVQQIIDVADAVNYAPLWYKRPIDGAVRSVAATCGFTDTYTPKNAAFAMATAGWVPLIKPVAQDVPGLLLENLVPFDRPASNNVTGPGNLKATCGFMQFQNDGHFAIYNNADASQMVTEFLRTAGYTSTPVLGY